MYRLLKEKGNNLNVILENTETHAQLNLGKLTIDMLSLLERAEDLTFGEVGAIQFKDEWNIPIKDETAKELSAKAMRMSKPIRDQRKHKEEEIKKSNKEIDAMDVLLGLANYNQGYAQIFVRYRADIKLERS